MNNDNNSFAETAADIFTRGGYSEAKNEVAEGNYAEAAASLATRGTYNQIKDDIANQNYIDAYLDSISAGLYGKMKNILNGEKDTDTNNDSNKTDDLVMAKYYKETAGLHRDKPFDENKSIPNDSIMGSMLGATGGSFLNNGDRANQDGEIFHGEFQSPIVLSPDTSPSEISYYSSSFELMEYDPVMLTDTIDSTSGVISEANSICDAISNVSVPSIASEAMNYILSAKGKMVTVSADISELPSSLREIKDMLDNVMIEEENLFSGVAHMIVDFDTRTATRLEE